MEAERASETSVNFYHITQCYNNPTIGILATMRTSNPIQLNDIYVLVSTAGERIFSEFLCSSLHSTQVSGRTHSPLSLSSE
jgi:hypothetical protein